MASVLARAPLLELEPLPHIRFRGQLREKAEGEQHSDHDDREQDHVDKRPDQGPGVEMSGRLHLYEVAKLQIALAA